MGFPSSAKSKVDEGRPIAYKTRFFDFPRSGRKEKTPLRSNSRRSVLYLHFGWAFRSRTKSRVDEGRPIAFKTRNGGMKPDLVEFDRKSVFSIRPDGESEKNAF